MAGFKRRNGDNKNGEKNYPPRLNEKQRELFSKGICFKCEKKGHRSRDCPERRPSMRASLAVAQEGEEHDEWYM